MKNYEDVALWPDGTWCFGEDLEEYLNPPCAMSDDYKILKLDSEAWKCLMEQEEMS